MASELFTFRIRKSDTGQTVAKRTAYFTLERYLQFERDADERGF
jgi:hypothetical protein